MSAQPSHVPVGTDRPRVDLDRRLCVAPMLDWTDRHYRFLARQFTRRTLLYTEMVTTGALAHGERERFLRYHPDEHPLALQLGGSEPTAMAACAAMAAERGYDEVNINVGCPSDRVQSGRFGACLMAEPGLVADCVRAMKSAVSVPVTVKTRIGIDERDSYEHLCAFTDSIASAGCDALIVHARKAWLKGLSPKENRDVPPLRYDVVERLNADFPSLPIVINGGIRSLEQAEAMRQRFDGVMIGREAYYRPQLLADADAVIFGDPGAPRSEAEVLDTMIRYVEQRLREGVPLSAVTRHLLGLFHGRRGAKAWRRHLSEHAHRAGAGIEVLRDAARAVFPEQYE